MIKSRINTSSNPVKSKVLRSRLEQQNPKGRDVLAEYLVNAGIKRIYTIPGDIVLDAVAAASRAGIKIVSCRNHPTAVFAAAGDNFASGEARAAVFATRGPGVASCAGAIASVAQNSLPLLFMAASEDGAAARHGAFQGHNAVAMISAFAKRVGHVETPDQMAGECAATLAALNENKPGLVILELTRFSLEASTTQPHTRPSMAFSTAELSEMAKNGLNEIAHALANSHRSLVIIGRGVRWNPQLSLIRQLVEISRARVVASPMAAGVLPENHPDWAPEPASVTLAQSDFVLLLGARLNWTFNNGAHIPHSTPIAQIDLANPVQQQGREPDLAVTADLAVAIPALVKRLKKMRLQDEFKRDWPLPSRPSIRPGGGWIHELARSLNKALPANCITIFDGNVSMKAGLAEIRPGTPWSRITPGTDGHLGSGIGYGIGAQFASPDRTVALFLGDFALGLSLADLETLVRYEIPLKIVVVDNQGMGGIDPELPELRGLDERVTRFQNPQRFDLVMSALGGIGMLLRDRQDATKVFRQAFDVAGPVLIHATSKEFSD